MELELDILNTKTTVTVGAEALAEHPWVTADTCQLSFSNHISEVISSSIWTKYFKHFNSFMQILAQFLKQNKLATHPSSRRLCGCVGGKEGDLFMLSSHQRTPQQAQKNVPLSPTFI